MKKTVPYITGDGVGAEITPAMQAIVNAAVKKAYGNEHEIEWMEVLAGERAFNETGSWLPDETMEAFKKYGVGIKGPLTTPVGGGIRSLNVALRQTLDLYVCLRPVRWFSGVVSPVKEPQKVDMHIFRENTEDIYAGIEWEAGTPEAEKFYRFLHDEMKVTKVRFPETSSFGVKPVSKEGTERLVRAACKYALEHGLPSVTLVHKGNIMKFTEGGFKKWGYELAEREFGDAIASGKLVIKDCIADAFLQNTLLIPEEYSVVATLNLNGRSEERRVGKEDVVNPCSLILSAVMMLEHFGWNKAAELIVNALESSFGEGRATHDLARFMPGGVSLGTSAFTKEIIERINS